jgi:CRP-like cAMP-binding protein
MTSETVLRALQSMEILSELTSEQMEKLASIATRVTFSEGAIIFREGDISELVYLIEEGQVDLETKVPGHGQVLLLKIVPGQLLGWSSIFPPKRKTASARAAMATQTIAINAEKLNELLQEDHDLGFIVMWEVAEVISNRLAAARMQLLDVFAPTRGR